MDNFMLSGLLVLLSAVLRSFVVNKSGTPAVLAEIALGLPADLSFVSLSAVIAPSTLLQKDWVVARPLLIVGVLIIAVVQVGALYKPCKEFLDQGDNWKAFGLWLLNVLVTFLVLAFLVLEVIKK